jgi:hypothetical protein
MTEPRDDHQPAVVAEMDRIMRGSFAFEAALKELVAKAFADRLPPLPVSHALEDKAKAYRHADRVRRQQEKTPN